MSENASSESHFDEIQQLRTRLEQLPLAEHVGEFDRVITDLDHELSLDT